MDEERCKKLFEIAKKSSINDQDIEEFKELLDSGCDPNIKDEYGRTPLHLSSGRGHIALVKLLINYGADASAKDNQGSTPLHYAAAGKIIFGDTGDE